MMYFASAIYKLYPQVTRTVGEDAFDINGNQVFYNRQEVEKHAQYLEAHQARAAAYSQEADPIAFKMLRGEVTKEEWEAKIEEIRQRYPYPS